MGETIVIQELLNVLEVGLTDDMRRDNQFPIFVLTEVGNVDFLIGSP